MTQPQVFVTPVFKELLKNTTHKNLAKSIGVSRSLITSIATNQRTPSLPVALKIAKHFNKNVNELFILETE
ncbi:MAG: helix-turn-helix transcriptional regulator, partial [Desulfofundulus sp.]